MTGFTPWSDSRTPTDVFNLLETVYGEFDVLAKKFKIFKVETIGDCYLAVSGLPEPRQNHAVLMCRFAQECNTKLAQLRPSLVEQFGEDTADLCMRAGIHVSVTKRLMFVPKKSILYC